MRCSVLVEPVEPSESMPGRYSAHVPSLGITTRGSGMEGAIAAARDLDPSVGGGEEGSRRKRCPDEGIAAGLGGGGLMPRSEIE